MITVRLNDEYEMYVDDQGRIHFTASGEPDFLVSCEPEELKRAMRVADAAVAEYLKEDE